MRVAKGERRGTETRRACGLRFQRDLIGGLGEEWLEGGSRIDKEIDLRQGIGSLRKYVGRTPGKIRKYA